MEKDNQQSKGFIRTTISISIHRSVIIITEILNLGVSSMRPQARCAQRSRKVSTCKAGTVEVNTAGAQEKACAYSFDPLNMKYLHWSSKNWVPAVLMKPRPVSAASTGTAIPPQVNAMKIKTQAKLTYRFIVDQV
jgi:hypothetical protein